MLRGISLFVATVFTVTTLIGNPSEAMAAIESFAFQDHAKFQKELQGYLYSLPPEIGTISETYFGERGTGRAERTSETVNRLSSPVSQHEQFIVLVQDAHANPEGQQNVAAMLKYLETKVPGLVIGLEGASGELHPEYLNLAKGFPEANRAVIEDLHQKGELNGAELYLLGQHQHIKPENGERETNPLNVLHASSRASQAYGIENTALYHDDLDTYRDLLSHTDEIQTLLNPLRAELEKESSQKLNGELRAFLKERSRRKDGRFGIQTSAQSDPDFQAYTRYLRQQALKLLEIDLKDAIEQLRFPNLFRIVMLEESRKGFDPEAAKSQWNEVVQTLQAAAKDAGEKEYVRALSAFGQENGFLKKNIDVPLTAAMGRALYPRKLLEGLFRLGQKHQLSFDGKEAFWKTWKLAVFQAEIDVTELMREMDMLEGQMIEKLARSEAEKALVQKLGTFDLLEKMLRLELSRSEYDKTREDEAAIRSFSADSKYLGAFLDKAEHFYEVSLRRDEALVTNLLALTQGERYPGKSQPKGSSVPRVSVLYSGGFHTPGVEEILRQKGIGYAVFSPRITRTDHGEMYQKVMAGDNADLSAYFKVKNPFATKQAAIFFKEMLEVAAPALFEKYQMKPEEIAANVQRSIGSNPVLSTAVTVEPVGPKESASLSFQSTGRRESVPKNSAVMPESLTAVWWRSPDAGEVTSVNLANSAVTTTVSFPTPKALMLNIIQGIPTKQQTVTLNGAVKAEIGSLDQLKPAVSPQTQADSRQLIADNANRSEARQTEQHVSPMPGSAQRLYHCTYFSYVADILRYGFYQQIGIPTFTDNLDENIRHQFGHRMVILVFDVPGTFIDKGFLGLGEGSKVNVLPAGLVKSKGAVDGLIRAEASGHLGRLDPSFINFQETLAVNQQLVEMFNKGTGEPPITAKTIIDLKHYFDEFARMAGGRVAGDANRSELRQDKPRGSEKKGRDQGLRPKTQGAIPKWIWAIPAAFLVFSGTLVYLQSQRNADRERNAEQGQLPLPVLVPGDNLQQPTSEMVFPTSPISILQGLYPAALEDQPSVVTEEAQRVGARHESLEWEGRHLEALYGGHGHPDHGQRILQLAPEILKETNQWVAVLEDAALLKAMSLPGLSDSQVLIALAEMGHLPVIDPLEGLDHISSPVLERVSKNLHRDLDEVKGAAFYMAWLETLSLAQAGGQNMDLEKLYQSYLEDLKLRGGYQPSEIQRVLVKTAQGLGSDKKKNAFAALMSGLSQQTGAARGVLGAEQLRTKLKAYPDRHKILSLTGGEYAKDFYGLPNLMHSQEGMIHAEHVDAVLNSLRDLKIITPKGTKPRAGASPLFPGIPLSLAAMARLTRRGKEQVANARAEARVEKIELSAQTIAPLADDLLNNLWNRGITLKRYAPDGESFSGDEIKIDNKKQPVVYSRKSAEAGRAETAYVWTFDRNQGALLGYKGEDGSWRGYALFNFRGKATYNVRFQVFEEFRSQGQGRRFFDFFRDVLGQFYKADTMIFQFIGAEQASLQPALSALGFQSGERSGEMVYSIKPSQEMLPSFKLKDGKQRSETRFDNVRDGWSTVLMRSSWEDGTLAAMDDRSRMAFLSKNLSKALKGPDAAEHATYLDQLLLRDKEFHHVLPEAEKLIRSFLGIYRFPIKDGKPVKVGVEFSMYGEQNRLMKKSADNPHGEDAIAAKLEELDELFSVNPKLSYELLIMDDGERKVPDGALRDDELRVSFLEGTLMQSPFWQWYIKFLSQHVRSGLFFGLRMMQKSKLEGNVPAPVIKTQKSSGEVALDILRERFPDRLASGQVQVRFINRQQKLQIGGKKGSGIILGMRKLLEDGCDYVIFTDADRATHMGQSGLLLEQLANGKADAAIGSRWQSGAVVKGRSGDEKRGSFIYNMTTKLFLGFWGIRDTQCGFKGFTRELLEEILPVDSQWRLDPDFTYNFAFDTHLLLRIRNAKKKILEVPVVWIGSPEESTLSTESKIEAVLSLAKQVPFIWSSISSRSEVREPLKTRSEMREKFRNELIPPGQRYVNYISAPDEFASSPDAFLLLGNPSLRSFLEFSKKWKAIKQETGRSVPIVLAGGYGRGTPPLARRIIDHYKSLGRLDPAEEAWIQRAMTREGGVYESDLMRFVLEREGVAVKGDRTLVRDEIQHSTVTVENFTFSAPVIETATAGVEHPVIAIVTAPQLLRRAQATARKAWDGKTWTPKKYGTYPVQLEGMTDEELIEMMGYVIGYPQAVVDSFKAKGQKLNLFSEYRGLFPANNPSVLPQESEIPANVPEDLQTAAHAFEGFLGTFSSLRYEPVGERLAPETVLVQPGAGSSESEKAAAVLEALNGLTDFQRSGTGQLLDFAGETALMDLGDIKALLTKGELSGKKGARAVTAGKLKEWIERPVVREVDEGHAHEVIRVVPGGFENFGIFIRELGEIGLLEHDAIFSLMEAFVRQDRLSVTGLEKLFDAMIASGFLKESEKEAFLVRARKKQFSQTQILRTVPKPPEAPGPGSPSPRSEVRVREVIEDGTIFTSRPAVGQILQMQFKQKSKPGDETDHATFHWDMPRSDSFAERFSNAQEMAAAFAKELTTSYQGDISVGRRKDGAGKWVAIPPSERGLLHWIFPAVEAGIFRDALSEISKMESSLAVPGGTGPVEHPVSRILSLLEASKEVLVRHLQTAYEHDATIPVPEDGSTTHDRANLAVKELIRLVADFVQMFYLTQNGKDDLGFIQRLVNEKAALYAAVFESQTKMLTTTALYVAMKKEAQATHDLEKKELEHIRDVLSQSPLPKRFSAGGWKQEIAAIIQGRFQSLDGELGRQLEVTHAELEKVADEKPDSFPKRDLLYKQQALEKRRKAIDVRLRELTAQLSQAADISKFLGAVRKDLKILATTMEIDKKYIDEHEDAPTRSNAASGKQQIYEGFPFTLNERVEKETQQKSGASMLRLLYDDFFLRVFQSRLRMGVHRGTQNFTSFSDSGKTGQDFFREVMDDLEAKEEGNQGKGVPDAGASYILVVPLETSNLDISRMMERYKHQIKGIIGVGANRQTHWVVLIRGRAYVPQILLVPASQEGKLTKLEGTKAILMPQQGRQGLLILNPSLEDLAAEKKKAEDYRRLRRFQGLMRNIPSSIPIAGNFEAQSTVAAIEGGTLPGLIRTDVDIVPKNEDDSSGVLFQYLKTLATGVVETKVDPLKWLQSFQTRSEIRTAGSEDLMARFSRLDPEGVGNAEAIHGLLKFWAVPFEQILTQKAFSGGDVPIRTIDLQRDSKNRAILQMLEAIAAEHPASTLRKDPSQPISGFDLYENSSLGELVLVLELAAMIVAAQKAGRTLSETERGRLVPLFPLIKTHAQFEWIRKKLWPLAQQIALWEIATGSGANPEEIERAEGDIRKIGEETRFGIMVEYMSLLEVTDPEDQTPDPSKRKKTFSPEMVKFWEDPFIVRLNVGNNDLWKDYWQTKNVEVDRENSAAAFLMDDLDGHLTVTLEALISRAQQSGKKVCFCGGIAETDKFLLAAEWWRRKFGVKDLSAKDSPFSVSVTGDVVARVNHALQVFRAIPDEELSAVFGAAEGSDILDGRAQELSNRYLSVSEKVSILVEEWQERYESAGFHHALYRLNIDPEKGIGGSSEFIFLKNLMQVWLANDPEALASLRLSSTENSVDRSEIQRILQYLANRGMLIPANIEKVLQSFDFIQSVQETYRELQGKDPDKFSGNLYPAIMGEFINAWEKKYGRPDWLAEGRTDRDETSAGDRKEEQRINDFYRYFHNSAASIFYTVRRTLHEIDGVLIRPVYTYGENEGKLEAFAGWDGQPSWILGQTRYGLTMSRERGRKGEAGYYIHVDHALENFRANPALMFRVFMLAAEKGAFISHRTQWAMEALMLEGSLDYQDAFNDFFGELLRSKKDISYVMWRMEEFGFLDKSLHHLSELNMYSLKDGTLFPLKMQALQTLETLERLDTKEKGFVYQRAAGVYRELRSDPEAVQLARLAVMLHPIVEVEAGDRFSVEDVKRITHEFLQKSNMDQGSLDQPNPLRDKLVWLMLNQHRFARHGFLSEDDIVKTMSEVVHSKGVTLDLFRVLYAVTFSKQAAEANPESRIMLPRQGADSPLADLDMLFFAGMKMLGDKQLSAQTAMKEAKQTVIWGGKEELAAQLGEFIRAQKWGSILDDYLANTQGGDDVSLRELLVKTVETPALFDPLFRQFSGRTSTYYMRTMDLGSLLKQLFFFRHLLYLKEKGDRSTRATIFSPLPHQYNQAYEVIFGSAFEESGDVALYTRTLFENGFSVENAAIRNPPGQPAFIRYLGFFPHGEEMPMVQKKITSELGAIFAPINIGDKVFRILKTDMEIRFKRADEVYGRSIIVDKRDAWIGPETKAKFLDDVSHQGKTVSVLTVHIASSNWRGQLLILSTVLSLIHGCDIENLKFEHIKGFPPETQIFLTRKGKILSRAQKDLIAKNVARILDMKPITILGKEAVVEQPTPKSEKIVKNLRINPLTKLHNRPASQLVKLIAQYNVENAVLRVADRDINLKSIGAVLASGIVGGTDVTIILEGKKNAKLKELMYRIQAEVVGEQGDSEGPIKLFMPSQRSEMRAHEWREFLIVSKRGIHAVPTELIVKTIKNHQNLMIRVENENGEVRATFPNNQTLFMSIMRLAAAPGSTMKFVVEGPDQRSIQNFFTELLATAKDGNEDIFRQVQSESKVLPPGFTAGVMEAAVVIKIAERSETRVQEERESTVLNKLGIHAQPSTLIKKVGDRFPELEIEVEKDGERVNGKKIMGLLALAAGPGSVLKFVVKGPEVLIRRYFQELAMIEDNGEKVFKIPPRAESRPLVPILKSGVMELASGILSSRRSEVRTKEGISRRVAIQRGLLAFAGIALLGGISEILAEQREKAGEKKFAPADYQLEVVPVSDSLINAIRNPKSGLIFASTINPYRVNDKDQKIPSGWVIANVNGKRVEVSSRNPNNFGSAMAKVIGVVDRSGRLRFYDNQTYRTTGQEIFAFQAGPFAVKPGGQINENVREWYRALFHGKASVIGVDAKGNVYTKLFVGQEPFGITGRLRAKAMMEELAAWKKTNGITEATFVDSGTAGISRYDRKSPPYVLIARKRLPAVVPVVTSKPRSELRIPAQGVVSETGEVPEEFVGTIISTKPEITPADSMKFAELLGHIFLNALIVFNFYRIEEKGKAVPGDEVFLYLGEATDMLQALYDELNPENPKGSLFFSPRSPRMFFTASTPAYGSERHKPEVVKYEGEAFKAMAATLGFNELRESMKTPLATLNEIRKSVPEEDVYSELVLARLQEAEEQLKVAYRSALDRASGRSEKKIGVTTPLNVEEEALRGQDQLEREARQRAGFDRYTVLFEKVHELAQQTDNPGASVIAGISRFASEVKGWEIEALIKEYFRALKGLRDGEYLNKMPSSFFSDPESYEGDVDRNLFVQLNTYMQLIDDTEMKAKLAGEDFTLLERSAKDWLIFRELNRRVKSDPELADQADALFEMIPRFEVRASDSKKEVMAFLDSFGIGSGRDGVLSFNRIAREEEGWFMKSVRPEDKNGLVVTNLTALPVLTPAHPLESFPVLGEGNYGSVMVLLGPLPVGKDGKNIPAVIKLFRMPGTRALGITRDSSKETKSVLDLRYKEELSAVQVLSILGVGPKLYGVLRDQDGLIMGYAMQYVVGESIPDIIKLFGFPGIQELFKKLMSVGLTLTTDVIRTPSGDFVQIDPVVANEEVFQAFVRAHTSEGSAQVSSWPMVKTGRSGNVGIPPAPVSFHIPAREEALGEVTWQTNEGRQITFNVTSVVNKDDDLKRIILRQTNPPAQGIPFAPDLMAYSIQGKFRGVYINPSNRDITGKGFLAPLLKLFFDRFPEVRSTHELMINPAVSEILARDYDFKPAVLEHPVVWMRKDRANTKVLLFFENEEDKKFFYQYMQATLAASYEIANGKTDQFVPMPFGVSLVRPGGAKDAHNPDIRAESRQLLQDRALDKGRPGFSEADIGNELKAIYDKLSLGGAKNVASAGADIQRLMGTYDLEFPSNEGLRRLGEELIVILQMLGDHAPASAKDRLVALSRKPYIESLPQLEGFIKYLQEPKGGQTTLSGDLVRAETRALDVMRAAVMDQHQGRFVLDGLDLFPLLAPTAVTHIDGESGELCYRILSAEASSDLAVRSGTQVFIFLPGEIDQVRRVMPVEKAEQILRSATFEKDAGRSKLGKDGDIRTLPEFLRLPYIQGTQEKLAALGETRNFLTIINTSKAQTADEAIQLAAFGIRWFKTPFLKIEVRDKGLMTRNDEILNVIKRFVEMNKNLKLLPLIGKGITREMLQELLQYDQVLALRIEGTKPGSGKGLGTPEEKAQILQVMAWAREMRPGIQLIAECGIGSPEDARVAMQMGFNAVLVNAAITQAEEPVKKAIEFSEAVQQAAREAPLRSEVRSSPIEDVVRKLYRDAGLEFRPFPMKETGKGEGFFVRTALKDMVEIIKAFPIAQDKTQTVLDAGHGDGVFLIMLAHAYPQSKFTGIEMDPELFEASQKLLAVAESQGYVGKGQIQLYPGNFRSEESVGHFKDADVIYYYSSGTSNVEILAQTIVAHLKSGGKVVEYGPEQLLEPLRQSGGIFDDRVIDFNPAAATVFKRIHVYTRRSEARTGPDSKAFKTLEKLVNVLEGTEVTVRGLVMMETENAITVVFEHEGLQLKGLLRLRDPKTATAFFLANRNKKIKVSLREIRPRAKDGYVFLADNIGKSPEAIRKESTAGALAFWKQASEQPSLAVSLPEILDHLVEARVLYVELRRSREQGAPRTLWLMQNGNMGIVGETAAPARVEALAKKSEVFQILRRLMTDRAQKVLLVMDDKASGNGTLIFPPSLIPASKSGAYGVRFSVKSNIEAPISMEFPFIRIYLRSSGAGLNLLLDGRDVPLLSRADVREFLQLPPAPSSARFEVRRFSDDRELKYDEQQIPITSDKFTVKLPAYAARFLRLVNPSHPLLRQEPYVTDAAADIAKGTRISLIHEIPKQMLSQSTEYRRLLGQIKSSKGFLNGKIVLQDEDAIHLTVAGALEKRPAGSPGLVPWVQSQLKDQSPVMIRAKGLWTLDKIGARLFLRIYPELNSVVSQNKFSDMRNLLNTFDGKVFAVPLLQLKDDLSSAEAQELQEIFDAYKNVTFFEYQVDSLDLVQFDNDLLGGKKLLSAIPLETRSEARLPVGTSAVETLGLDTIKNYVADKFGTPVRLTDGEVKAYFGEKVLRDSQREGRAFFIQKLDPKEDIHFLGEWKAELQSDEMWLRAREAKGDSREITKQQFPYFGYISDVAIGVVSRVGKQERLEGFVGFDGDPESFDVKRLKYTFHLAVPQIEIYYKNIGSDGRIKGVADLLMDTLISMANNPDLRVTGGIRFNAMTPGSQAFAKRRGFKPGIGVERILSQESVQREVERIAKVTPSGIGGRPEMRGSLADILKEKFSVGSVLASADLDTGMGNFIPEFKTFLERMGYRVNTAIGTEPLQSIIDKAPAGIRGSIVHANAQFPEEFRSLGENTFDIVTINHIETAPGELARRAKELLKPSGLLLVTIEETDVTEGIDARIIREIREAGFDVQTLKKPTDYPEYNTQFRSQVLLVAVPKSFRFNPPAKQDGSGAFPRAEIRVLDLGQGATRTIQTVLGKIDFKPVAGLLSEAIQIPVVEAAEAVGAFSAEGIAAGLKEGVTEENLIKARLWIAMKLLEAFRAQQSAEGRIDNEALQKVIASLERFKVTGAKDSTLEERGVHVALPLLTQAKLEALAEFAPILLAFAVALNTKLYLNVQGAAPKGLEQKFLDRAARNGITIAEGQFRIFGAAGSEGSLFRSLKEPGVREDVLLAGEKKDLPGTDRATLWYNSPEAQENMKILAAEISEALYAALDPKISKGSPRNIATHFQELTTALMNAIEGFQSVKQSA